eukprot:TRINITY_DN13469_c0_g1_i6.p1 TRINITY_DN13469_c0_g1~~TRINITY_DN13469_c0_g1_i6.p1  ORF type:complete len:963 (-),score=252.46 TRINITY_DN13469_c0_g1_i6:527-3415(-)
MSVELKPLLSQMMTKKEAIITSRPARAQSCLHNPQESAVSALERRDLKSFIDALAEEEFDVNQEYGDDIPKTLLHMAIEEATGKDEFVSALITAGAKADLKNTILETVPFHDVIRNNDPELLKLVLRSVSNINIQDGEGSSALHIATEGLMDGDEEDIDKLVECIGILLQFPGIEMNSEDMKGEATPLFYAATAGNEKVVDLLLSFGADAHNNNTGETICDVIRQNIPNFDPEKFNKTRKGRPIKNILFNMIELADNVEGFRMYVSNRDDMDWNADNGQYTLLQYASEQGRDKITAYLLDHGAEPGRCAINGRPAWGIAAYHGYHKVLKVFFEKLTEDEIKKCIILSDSHHGQRTILHEVVRRQSPKLSNPERDENMNYEECLKLLFNEKKGVRLKYSISKHTERIINFRDAHGETALHYATQQPNQELIKLLLKHGANMGVKNDEGKSPVNRILPTTLADFFNSCLEPKGIITDDEFKMTFDYNFLAPPLLDAEILDEFEAKKSLDIEKKDVRNARPETEALWYMSESKQHRHLLKHPLISSFLWMKWQRIRSFYYLGLVFYFLFVASLTFLIVLDYGGCSLLPASMEDCRTTVDTTALKVVVGIFTVCLFFVEVMQIAVSFKRYFASPENLMQNAILLISAILILDKNLDWEDKRHLAALVIVLSWLEFLIYLGLHPSLNTKVFMFYRVVTTFFQFLLWYGFVIIAFSLSFYIMFHTDYKGGEQNPDYTFFDKPGSCLTKTIGMFVGELEFSDIPFSANPISSILFIAFIFLIVVVLMNLLNGLAVSDIGLIRDEAEVLSLKSQVDLISYWESILLNDPYNFLTSWPKFLAAIPSCSFCFWVKRLPGCETFLSKITGGTRILLFYECLPSKTATFFPNKRTMSCNPYKKRVKVEPNNQGGYVPGLEVRKDILETAKTLVLERQIEDVNDQRKLMEMIEKMMDRKLSKLTNQFDSILKKLQ